MNKTLSSITVSFPRQSKEYVIAEAILRHNAVLRHREALIEGVPFSVEAYRYGLTAKVFRQRKWGRLNWWNQLQEI